jgi:hypothetical protein
MSTIALCKKLFAVLVVAMAVGMFSACSTTDESSGGGESQSVDECTAACADGDLDCREVCVMQAPV